MLLFRLLSHSSFAFIVLGADSAEVGDVEKAAATSPREGLRSSAEKITRSPLGRSLRCAVSKELAEDFESLLELTVANIHEFANDYDGCLRALRPLVSKDVYLETGSLIQSYNARYQSLEFLALRIEANRFLLKRMELAANLWRGAEPSWFDALARLLKTGAEALQVRCKIKLYVNYIIHSRERLFRADQDAQQGVGSIEEFERLICTDYEELSDRLVEFLDKTLEDFEKALEVLGDTHCGSAYQLFKRDLEEGFESLLDRLPKSMRRKTGFGSEQWRRLTEAQALMRARVFWAILAFKRKFPRLDHEGGGKGTLFPKRVEFRGAFDEGPPLIEEDLIRREFGGDSACLDQDGDLAGPQWALREAMGKLTGWTYSLHLRLGSEDHHYPLDGQVKQWVRDVEGNLCLMLEIIVAGDEQRERYMLGAVLQDLTSIAFDIERVLGSEEGYGPSHFCRKLAQIIESVCSPPRAPSTGEPTPLHVDATEDADNFDPDNVEEGDGAKTGPVRYEPGTTIGHLEGGVGSTEQEISTRGWWSYGSGSWVRRTLLKWNTEERALWIIGGRRQRHALMILFWLIRIMTWSIRGLWKRQKRR